MFIWNSRPVVEELFFGDEATAIDIWGRPVEFQVVDLPDGGKAQRIQIGKWPIIIQDVDSSIIRWRQEFQVLVNHLNSHLSTENSLPIQLQNTFSKRAKGTLVLRSPGLLKGGERPTDIDLETGHTRKLTIPMEFRSDASAGMHQLEFQFQLRADKDYFFSLHRKLPLGHPDIDLRWDLTRVSDEIVEAKVELTNKTNSSVDFDCTVFPFNQPYLRIALTGCSPGTTTKVQNLPIPKSPVDKRSPIWIRCTQIRSPLTLNYRVEEQQGVASRAQN
jgi:hypothetical protein